MFSKEKKLLEALKVIRAECIKHDGEDDHNSCYDCPLGTDSGHCCVNAEMPYEWKLVSDKLFV